MGSGPAPPKPPLGARAYAFRAVHDALAPPRQPRPPAPLSLPQESLRARTRASGVRDVRAPQPSHLPTLLLLYDVRHSSFSSPSVSPSFPLIRDPIRSTGGHQRNSFRAPSNKSACAHTGGRGRAAVRSPSSLPLLLLYNLTGLEEVPPESEGGELGGGISRVVETSDWEKSQPAPVGSPSLSLSLNTPTPPSAPACALAPFLARGTLPVTLRVSARRGRPGGALALRERADGRRAGCGAWCLRSWAACPAR